MAKGWLNPSDDTRSVLTREARVPSSAGARRWPSAANASQWKAQDLADILGALRDFVDYFGVTDVEGEDSLLRQAILAGLSAHARTNWCPNPGFLNWPYGPGPFMQPGETAGNWYISALPAGYVSSITQGISTISNRYALIWDVTAIGTGAIALCVPIADARFASGRQMTISGYISADGDTVPGLKAQFDWHRVYGVGGSASEAGLMGFVDVPKDPTYFSVTATVPSTEGKTFGTVGSDQFAIVVYRTVSTLAGKIKFEDIKLEFGSWPSVFTEPGPRERNTDLGTPPSANFLENPSFDIWQENISYAPSGSALMASADRWRIRRSGGGATMSRQTGFGSAQYCMRLQRNSGDSGVAALAVGQQIESITARRMAGRYVVLSFDAVGGADFSANGAQTLSHICTGTGVDETLTGLGASMAFPTGSVVSQMYASAYGQNRVEVGGVAKRIRTTPFLLPSNTSEIAISISFNPTGTAGNNDYLDITNVKLEVCGPAGPATVFVPVAASDVLRACQRHYCKSFALGTVPDQNVGITTGEQRFPAPLAGAVTERLGTINLPVSMRVVPSITLYNPAANNGQVRDETASVDCSAAAVVNITESTFEITATGHANTLEGDELGVHWVADARF